MNKKSKECKEYQKVQEHIELNFNSFLYSACEELIKYYGEEYRDIITHRLNNTNFVFYVKETEKLVGTLEEIFNKESLDEDYKIIKKQHKKVTKYIKKNNELNSENEDVEVVKMVNRKAYDTSNENYNEFDKSFRENSLKDIVFKYGCSCYTPIYFEDTQKIEHDIIIPLFKADDEDLIHEMIHAIMSQDLLIINNNKTYHKTGLAIRRDAEDLLEEWITEIEAKRINKNLKDKGIELIDKFFPKRTSKTSYDIFIPFVQDFYDYFKDILIYSRITLNKNYLLEQIDRNNYYDFMLAIIECYRGYFESDDFYYYKLILEKETKKMKDSYSVLKLK